MNRILIVKVTSLGDVVQTLPVVADIHRAFPGVTVDWAVDESCAEVVRWHPGVSTVLCAPLRRFKKLRNAGDLKAITASIGALRAHRYDAVIDLHGVYKSAIIAALARAARRVGYQTQDLGETGARFAYSHRFGPRPACDAWHG
ncbi:glycosyltransferase family 9 protein, partial [Burkholderia multivorans]